MTSDEKKLLAIYEDICKIAYKGNCCWNNCIDKSILSHSHTKSILKNIAISNKIYGVNKNFIAFQKGDFFRSYGIKDASVFHGFCSKHDNQLFRSIESNELSTIDDESAFLFFARNIFFEVAQKKTAILRFQKLLQLAKQNHLLVHSEMIEVQVHNFEHFLAHKATFYTDKIYMIYGDQSFHDMNYLFKIINKPDISLSTVIDMNITGHTSEALPLFGFNIIPYKQYGIIILTWLNQHDEHMRCICDQFDINFNKLVNYLCFIESEDFLFSIKLYNEKIKNNYAFFRKAFFNKISFPDFGYNKTKIFFNFDQ